MRNPTFRWIGFKYRNDRLAELRRVNEYWRATMAPLTHSERVALQCKFTWPHIDHSECCEDG